MCGLDIKSFFGDYHKGHGPQTPNQTKDFSRKEVKLIYCFMVQNVHY